MKHDHWVNIEEIKPPMGELKFAAKATIHEIGKGEVDHGLGEVWGKTREEATQKMNEKIKQWLETQQ
ncbi:hypothetical protein HYW59_03310 [Candidatus Kaiserbacteria bacterium]|nr:hypothetical protein [Candidatus Kaiserbacteria bacterium]